MPAPILDDLRHETRFAMLIARRDVGRRLAAVAMILALCWFAGAGAGAAATALLILAGELSAHLACRQEPPAHGEVPLWLAAWMWLNNIATTVLYLVPALLLAAEPQMPLVLAGFLWLLSVQTNMSNNYAALPFYNWSQLIPAFALGLSFVGLAAGIHWGDGTPVLWALLAGLLVVNGSLMVETIASQAGFERELSQARADARGRLAALEHLTRHDPLTGLLNRQAFDEGLERMLAGQGPDAGPGHGVAVLLMDLDGFKAINDTYSHAAGDAVLAAVGRRLRAVAGEGGLAARLGGDEFALAVGDVGSSEAALALAAEAICQVERPIAHGERTLRISGSIGVGLSDGADGAGGASVAALCTGADQAMYRAKLARRAGGPARAVLYDPAHFPPRPSLEDRRRLAEAIAARDIRPGYQAIVDLTTGRVAGFEALARWHDGDACPAPGEFMPLVAEFGLQGDFLTAMAGQVLRDIAGLVADGLDPGRVSLNIPEIALATISGRQDLVRLLDAVPAARPHIVFEITEDVFIARSAGVIQESVAEFRRLGVGISLDDFGTGFASFQHLRSLEFDELKIDASFVADLGRDPVAEVVVGGFLSMGRGLGARLIAEGVETEAQRRHLVRLGCRYGQGFLFGRAAPLAEARARLLAAADPQRVGGAA